MAVSKLVAMGSRVGTLRAFNVEGTTYSPFDGKIEDWPVGRMDSNLQMIAKIAAVCNDADVEQSGNHYVAGGMPTEAALKVKSPSKIGFTIFKLDVVPVISLSVGVCVFMVLYVSLVMCIFSQLYTCLQFRAELLSVKHMNLLHD
jgi:Ca2+-transporting ATPase